jgi:dihydroxyacetone kinase
MCSFKYMYGAGMGIHNEPGASRLSPAPPLSQLIKTLVDHLTSTTDPERSFLPFVNTADPRDHNQDQDQTRDQVQAQVQDQANDTGADQVVLLVNNLGGTSPLELDAIARAAFVELQSRKIHVVRIVVGTLMTSLGMPGFSLTLLLLPRSHGNETDQKDYAEVLSAERILELLDAPTGCPAWPGIVVPHPWTIDSQSHSQDQDQAQTQAQNIHTPVPVHNTPDTPFIAALTRAAHALIAAEPVITRYDTIAGDGDCGATLKAGAEGVLTAIARGEIGGSGNKEGVSRDVLVLARVAEERMGGTSGALYSIFLAALAAALGASSASMARGASASDSISTSASVSTSTSEEQIAVQMWAQAGQTALQKLYTYTRARPPSRTLVDPLAAFLDALGSVTEEGGNSDNGKVDNRVKIAAAVRKAGEAAEKTRELEAKAGRAAYVEEGRLKEDGGMPDPGAWGVKVLLEGLLGDN